MSQTVLIAALAENPIGLIGDSQQLALPWGRISGEMKHFVDTTMGHCLIFGRKTLDGLRTQIIPLRGRHMTCITRKPRIWDDALNNPFDRGGPEHSTWSYNSIESAQRDIFNIYPGRKVFICGGAQIYAEALQNDLVDECLISYIKGGPYQGDTFFPLSLLHDRFREDWREAREGFDLVHYRRI